MDRRLVIFAGAIAVLGTDIRLYGDWVRAELELNEDSVKSQSRSGLTSMPPTQTQPVDGDGVVKTTRSPTKLLEILTALKTEQVTGSLKIVAHETLTWMFYCDRGRLIWQDGGISAQEWWLLQLQQHGSEYTDTVEQAFLQRLKQSENKGYDLINTLVFPGAIAATPTLQEVSFIGRSQRLHLIRDRLVEGIFDLLQYEWLVRATGQYAASQGKELAALEFGCTAEQPIQTPTVFLDTRQVLHDALERWQRWQQHGLAACLPSFFPIIRNPKALAATTARRNGQKTKLWESADGSRSFRRLAAQLKADELSVAKEFLPLLKDGTVKLSKVPVQATPVATHRPTQPSLNSQQPASSPTVNQEQPQGYRIACVDDSSVVLQQLAGILMPAGHECLLLDTPAQAVTQLAKWQPDLILLDLVMPQINGYELCILLRRLPSLAAVPIIILTGKDGLPHAMQAQFAGATEFVAKPLDRERIMQAVASCLQRV
ncbi:MAG: response regulator [Cyanobacteria bacterium P01_H01_bin.121]